MSGAVFDRLMAWRPSFEEYLSHPSISGGFLARAHSQYGEGLSVAIAERQTYLDELAAARAAGFSKVTTVKPGLARGVALHAWIEGDKSAKILTAPPSIGARRGKAWDAFLANARREGADAVLLADDMAELVKSWLSLLQEDTAAKREILAMLRRWSPRAPEVSHVWSPFEGCACRIREDLVAKAPSGPWGAVQIKTTTQPLTPGRWWRFWRLHYLRSTALYREGLRDLFAEEPFWQLLIVARLIPPYPWALFSLEERAEEIETAWRDDVLPQLEIITTALTAGRAHGPEEGGIFS